MGSAGAVQPHTSTAPHIAACWNPPRCGMPWAWGTPTLCSVPRGDKPASAALALIAANGIAMTQPSSLALLPAPSHPLSLPAPLLTQVLGPLLSPLLRLPVPCLGLLSICCRETQSEQNKLHPRMRGHEGPHVSSEADPLLPSPEHPPCLGLGLAAEDGDAAAGVARSPLGGTSLGATSLEGVSLGDASLEGTSLEGISLRGMSLEGVSLGGTSLGGWAVLPRGLLASEGAPLPAVGATVVLPWGSVSAGHGAVGTGGGWPAVLHDASSLGCSVVRGWGCAGGVLSPHGGTLSAEGATAAGMGDTGCPGEVMAAGTGQSCPGGGVAIGEGVAVGRTGRSRCGGLSPCTVSPRGGGSTLSPIGDGVFPATQSTVGHQRGLCCHHHPGGGGVTMQPHARCCVHNAQSTRTRLCQAPPPQNSLLPQQLLPHSRGKTPHQALGGGQALPGGCKALLLYWMGSRWVQDGRGLPA